MERLLYYPKNDLAGSIVFNRCKTLVGFLDSYIIESYDDVMELYNLRKYLNDPNYSEDWVGVQVTNLKELSKRIGIMINEFLSERVESFLDDTVVKSNSEQSECFWELVDEFTLFKSIHEKVLAEQLGKRPDQLPYIMKHSRVVKFFSHCILYSLKKYHEAAELLVERFLRKFEDSTEKLHFPKAMNESDVNDIVLNYLNSKNININYLKILSENPRIGVYRLLKKVHLQVNKAFNSENDRILAENSFSWTISVSLDENLERPWEVKTLNGDREFRYSLKLINKNLSGLKLLNNFKYLFHWLDHTGRIDLISKVSAMDVLEHLVGIESNKSYKTSINFNNLDSLSLSQLRCIDRVCLDNDIHLESYINEVFTKIFPHKLGFSENASFLSVSSELTYLQKTRLILPELENVLRQYDIFAEEGEIDQELISLSTEPVFFSQVKALNPKKYIYLNTGQELNVKWMRFLFSSQSIHAYYKGQNNWQKSTFFNLISQENVRFHDFENFQKPALSYWLDLGYLKISESGLIIISDFWFACLLKEYYENEVICYYHLSPYFQRVVSRLVSEGKFYEEATLLSKPEQAYFNFFLNSRDFTNGFDLRNRYLHGTQARDENSGIHEVDYYRVLRLLILVMLKIEDDLIIWKRLHSIKE